MADLRTLKQQLEMLRPSKNLDENELPFEYGEINSSPEDTSSKIDEDETAFDFSALDKIRENAFQPIEETEEYQNPENIFLKKSDTDFNQLKRSEPKFSLPTSTPVETPFNYLKKDIEVERPKTAAFPQTFNGEIESLSNPEKQKQEEEYNKNKQADLNLFGSAYTKYLTQLRPQNYYGMAKSGIEIPSYQPTEKEKEDARAYAVDQVIQERQKRKIQAEAEANKLEILQKQKEETDKKLEQLGLKSDLIKEEKPAIQQIPSLESRQPALYAPAPSYTETKARMFTSPTSGPASAMVPKEQFQTPGLYKGEFFVPEKEMEKEIKPIPSQGDIVRSTIDVANQLKIPADLGLGLIEQESGFRSGVANKAKNPDRFGLGQLGEKAFKDAQEMGKPYGLLQDASYEDMKNPAKFKEQIQASLLYYKAMQDRYAKGKPEKEHIQRYMAGVNPDLNSAIQDSLSKGEDPEAHYNAVSEKRKKWSEILSDEKLKQNTISEYEKQPGIETPEEQKRRAEFEILKEKPEDIDREIASDLDLKDEQKNASQELVNALKGFITENTVESLKNVQQRANRLRYLNTFIEGMEQIGRGIAGTSGVEIRPGQKFTALNEMADQLEAQFKERAAKEGDDPNSDFSKMINSFASKILERMGNPEAAKAILGSSGNATLKIIPLAGMAKDLYKYDVQAKTTEQRRKELNYFKEQNLNLKKEKEANSIFNSFTKDEINRIQGADRPLHIIQDIKEANKQGRLKSTKNIRNQLNNEINALIMPAGSRAGVSDRTKTEIKTLYGSIKDRTTYLSGVPEDTVPMAYLDQLEREVVLLQDAYRKALREKTDSLKAGSKDEYKQEIFENRAAEFLGPYGGKQRQPEEKGLTAQDKDAINWAKKILKNPTEQKQQDVDMAKEILKFHKIDTDKESKQKDDKNALNWSKENINNPDPKYAQAAFNILKYHGII